jgi:hypothetical protein
VAYSSIFIKVVIAIIISDIAGFQVLNHHQLQIVKHPFNKKIQRNVKLVAREILWALKPNGKAYKCKQEYTAFNRVMYQTRANLNK